MGELPQAFGPYVLLRELGQGSMGTVFLAKPSRFLRGVPSPLVLKLLLPELAARPDFVQRFEHEAILATRIRSPFLAAVYDAGKVEEQIYIAMQFVPGWSLERVVSELRSGTEPPSLASVADIAADALLALEALHEATDGEGRPLGAVHRDVNPRNLILGEDGRVRLIDLGVGKSRLQEFQTRAGALLGSPGFLAPEQIRPDPVDHRADLYALGAVLYELLTLEPYIPRGTTNSMLAAALAPRFRPPSELRPDLPASADALLAQALALEPAQRFPSARAFHHALRRVQPAAADRKPSDTIVGQMLLEQLVEEQTVVQREVEVTQVDLDEPPPATTVVFARSPEVLLISNPRTPALPAVSSPPPAPMPPPPARPAPAPAKLRRGPGGAPVATALGVALLVLSLLMLWIALRVGDARVEARVPAALPAPEVTVVPRTVEAPGASVEAAAEPAMRGASPGRATPAARDPGRKDSEAARPADPAGRAEEPVPPRTGRKDTQDARPGAAAERPAEPSRATGRKDSEALRVSPPPSPPELAPAAAREEVSALLRRALSLRAEREQRGEDLAALDELIVALQDLRRSADGPGSKARLEGLRARLEGLGR